MGRLSVDCCTEPTIFFGCNHHIQEGHGSIWFVVLTCKLNMIVYEINMFQKFLFVSCFDDYKGVIHKPLPHQRGCGDVLMALTSKFSLYKFATIGLVGEPMVAPSTCL